MRSLLMGAAAVALAASAATADPGKGNNGGNQGKGGGKEQVASPGKGQGQAGNRGRSEKQRVDDPGRGNADRGPPAQARGNSEARQADRSTVRRDDNRGNANRGREKREVREVRQVRDNRPAGRDRSDVRIVRTVVDFDRREDYGLIDGCPPGLAKKNNGCQPPGLAQNRDGYRGAFYQPSWFGYRAAGDGRYLYDNGYLYRVNDGGSVLGYIPLLGGALSIGNPWPSYYEPVRVPDYYTEYYNLGPVDSYRYADDVLYRVDPQTNVISSIAALLTGDSFNVGQPMPMGYDVYNVPYGYQDRYYDTPDAYYRYADGYVYQVDPKTQLIAAAIQLLT